MRFGKPLIKRLLGNTEQIANPNDRKRVAVDEVVDSIPPQLQNLLNFLNGQGFR